MSTLTAALALDEDLNYDALTVKYNDLQQLHEKSEQSQQALRNELQRIRSELQAAEARASELEMQKQHVTLQHDKSTSNERKLSELLANLTSSFTSVKESNKELALKNSELTTQYTKLRFEKNDVDATNQKNQSRLEYLEKRVDTLVSEKTKVQEKLKESQKRYRDFWTLRRNETRLSETERFELERANVALQSANQELRLELLQSQNKSESAAAQVESLTQKYAALTENHAHIKNEHRLLVDVYEQRLRESKAEHERLRSTIEADREAYQELEQQLQAENDRLQSRLDALELGGHDSSSSSSSGNDRYNKEREDLIAQRDGYEALCTRLRADWTEKDKQCSQLAQENQELRSEVDALTREIPTSQEFKHLKEEAANLRAENDKLSAQLGNTTYQLQYLLREVQSSEILAPFVDQSVDLDSLSEISPNAPHEQLVFKNVEELIKKNQSLQCDLELCNQHIRNKTNQINRTNKQLQDMQRNYSEKISTAEAKINDLLDTSSSLRTSLSEVTEKLRLSEKALQENIKRTSPFINTELQQKVKQYQQRIEQLESSKNSFYQGMQQDLARIRSELESAVTDAAKANEERKKVETELSHVKTEHARLVQALKLHSTHEEELGATNKELVERLEERDAMLEQKHTELINVQNTVETLQREQQTIKNELEFSNEKVRKLIDVNKKLEQDHQQVNLMMQEVTASSAGGVASSNEKINDILSSRLEVREKELRLLRDKADTIQKELQDYTQREQEYWKPMVADLERELKHVRAERIQLEKDVSTANEQRLVLENKLAATERELREANMTMGDGDPENFRMKLSAAHDEINELNKQVALYKERLDVINQQATALQQEHDDYVNEARGKLAKVHTALQERNVRIKEMETAVDENDTLKKEKSDLEEQLQREKSRTQQLEEEQKIREQEIEQLNDRLATNTQRIGKLETELDNASETITQITSAVQELRTERSTLTAKLAKNEAELYRITTELKAAELTAITAKEESQTKESALRAQLEEVRTQLANLSKTHGELLYTVAETQKSTLSPAEHAKLITDLSDRTVVTLREVNASLRHENDILYSQFNEAREESDRAMLHLELVRKQLESTRTELEKVRSENLRMGEEYSRSTTDAKHQAATYKESNERLQQKVTEFENVVAKLRQDLTQKDTAVGPLQARVQELESKAKNYEDTMKVVEETRKQWSTWTNQVLSKSNRIDPTEHQRFKDECEALRKQVQASEATRAELDKKLKDLTQELETTKQNSAKVQNIAATLKRRWNEAETKLKAQTASHDSSDREKELQKLLEEKENQLRQKTNAHEALQKKHKDLLAKTRSIITDKATLADESKKSQEELEKLRKDLQKATEDLTKSAEELKKCTEEKRNLEMENSRAKVKQSVDANKIAKLTSQLETLKRSREAEGSAEEGELIERDSKLPKQQ